MQATRSILLTGIATVLMALIGLSTYAQDTDTGWVSIVEQSMPAVVQVIPEGEAALDTSGSQRPGSGFVVHPSGLILTNSHVIAGRQSVTVRFKNGFSFAAVVMDDQPWVDLAVLKVDLERTLPYLQLSTDPEPPIGTSILSLSSPLSYPFSATTGIVSGHGRVYSDEDAVGLLQHDASINPGSSGSPLLDSHGRVVGVSTAIADEDLFNIGIGLAIPADVAATLVQAVIDDGSYEHGVLGLRVRTLTPEIAKPLGVTGTEGLLVEYVVPGSAASEGGFSVGDIVVAVDGSSVSNASHLRAHLWESQPGDNICLSVLRDGETVYLTAKLTARTASDQVRFMKSRSLEKVWRQPAMADFGLDFRDIRGAERRGGVVVAAFDENSPAEHAGLQVGDRIVMLNGKLVTSAEHAHRLLANMESDLLVLLVARTGSGQQFVVASRSSRRYFAQRSGVSL